MKNCIVVIFFLAVISAHGQDDLLKELQAQQKDSARSNVIQTFKGTRLVNGHSVETRGKGILEFIISHRFGTLNSGSYNLWGLDYSTIRIGLEYGISDRLNIGVGRSSLDKTFDGFVKYKGLSQSQGSNASPVSVTMLGGVAYKTLKDGSAASLETNERVSYTAQVLLARKFTPGFSFQVAPLLIHKNGVDQNIAVNDLFLLGLGSRLKLTRSVALNAEYYLRLNENSSSPNQNALGFGVEIETGGHVFQLIFTNSLGMTERIMAAETQGDFFEGDIHFGFNITRAFQLTKNKNR